MTWANQIRILKQNFEQLGSVVGRTLINALKPLVQALNVVMVKFIAFAETVSNALGKIFGWKYESASGGAGLADDMEDAAGSADDIADSTGTAADNIKKMQAGLRAFDELKTINLPDNSSSSGSGSGSGGSGGSSGTSGSSGQWVRQESMFEDYQSSIDSLYELGDYIGTVLTNALESIPWDDVYATASNFGTGLADFLNGLISPELFGALGTTVSNSLNTALHFLDSFGNTFDFENFGTSVRTGIENALTGIDWNLAQSAFETFGRGIAESLNALFEGGQGETILGTVGSTVAEALNTVISGALAFADDFNFEQFGFNLSEAVNGFFDTFDFERLASAINLWVDGLWATVTSFIDNLSFEDIFNGLKTFLTSLSPESIMTILGFSMTKSSLASNLVTAICTLFGIGGDGKKGRKISIDGVGLSIFLLDTFFTITDDSEETWAKALLTTLVAGWAAFKLSNGNPYITLAGVALEIGIHLGKFLWENTDEIKKKIKKLKEEIRKKLSIPQKVQGFDGETTIYIPISTVIDNLVRQIKNIKWSDILENIFNFDTAGGFFDDMIENFKAIGDSQDIIDAGAHIFEGIMDGFVGAFTGLIEPFADFFDWVWNGICDAFGIHSPAKEMKPLGKNIFLGIIEGWKDKISNFDFKGLGSKLVDKIKDGIKKVRDNVLEFGAKIKNDASEWWKNTKEWWAEKVGDVKEFTTGVKDKASEWWKNTKEWWAEKVGDVKEFTTGVKNSASTWWSNTKSYWSGKVGQVQDFVTDVKNNAFTWWSNTKKYWKEKVGDVQSFTTSLKDTSSKWWSDAQRLWNKVKGTLKIGLSLASDALSNIWDSVKNFFSGKSISIGASSSASKKAAGGVFANGSWKPIQRYAAGGIPNYGQMFIAREAGPELVGTLGGHTAVMNNDQIVASVSAGVYQAVSAAIGNNKGGNGNIHLTVNLDGKVVYDNVRARAQDYFNRTGEPAFPI